MFMPSLVGRAAARRLAAVLAFGVLAAAPAGAVASAPPADSTETVASDALVWARKAVLARAAVEAAETERDPERGAAAAAEALRAVRALPAGPAGRRSEATHDLAVRAQAAYERHYGPVHAGPLTVTELARLRSETLAEVERSPVPVLRDPRVVAAERAAAEAAARAAEAEAARAAGPAHLFYPTEAVAFVDEQRGVARRFANLRRRMRQHFPSVERTLSRRGLPSDLKYVAVIESALNPEAESHAGARGMWQFMPATAAEYGLDSLTVADPAASTAAAARYLQWLGRRYGGDWQLALAAYNCGVGRLDAIVHKYRRRHRVHPTFWDIRDALPEETQAYVPRFIALAELLERRG